jgi:hypothetical protein
MDDDATEPTPIADVRALYSGTGTQDITTPLLIQGIVTSINPQTNTNNIWVQDATGGIIVRFSTANDNLYKRGDEVIVNLEGARFNHFSGLIQVENVAKENGIASDKVEVISESNTLPTPQVVTFTQLKTDDFQGKLVAVENATFVDADGIAKMSGTRAITDGTETVNVRTESGAPFSESVMPLGSGTVKGLAGINAGVVQIIPMVFADDVFANNPVGTIGVTQALTDFGSVDNGVESTSQSYTIQGTTLANDLIITASGGFKVSLIEASGYQSSVTIPAATANVLTTVYVKFTPISGSNQVINGTISNKSQGATTVVFNVSGTESGNIATNLLIDEHFNYSIGQLTSVGGGANVSAGKWVNFSGTTNVLSTVSGNLSYTNYTAAEGNKVATINGSAEDAYTAFSQTVTTGKVYVAFLVNVKSATGLAANTSATGDYFAGILPSTSTTALTSRISVRAGTVTDTYNFGLRATSSNPETVFAPSDYTINETHLIVISYEIVDGVTNDVMNLWIDPDFSGAEPAVTLTQTGAAGDLADVARFFLRQGTNAVNADIDGIRAALTWADLFE